MNNLFHYIRHEQNQYVLGWINAWLRKNGEVYLKVVSKKKAKSDAQNKTFHKLVSLFHKSGCASFDNEHQVKQHYKKLAGITFFVAIKDGNAENYRKEEDVPQDMDCVFEVAGSWSMATDRQAAAAIDAIIYDMQQAGVASKEFDEMINQFNQWR